MVILGPFGRPLQQRRLALETRQGTSIPNEMGLELDPARKKAEVARWRSKRPCAIFRSISGVYNCAGMVLAFRRTWIEELGMLPRLLGEDGYKRIARISDARTGDLMLYRYQDSYAHIGILIISPNVHPQEPSYDVKVLSKWGGSGEFLHSLDCVPDVYGSPAECWSDRINPDLDS